MSRAIVIGGGWAGLSAAVELAGEGFKVTLLEQSGRLGGRAASFLDEKSGDVVDNGQHLFMGCYTHTINFLKKIGSFEKLKFQENLSIEFRNTRAQVYALNCLPLPSPLHLLSGLLGLGTLSPWEKAMTLRAYLAVRKWRRNGTLNMTVQEWLNKLGQSGKSQKYFWNLITLSALNEQPSLADADTLAFVLKEAFFGSTEKSRLAISTVGLSDLCGPQSEKYVKERNGAILLNHLVSKIEVENDSVKKIMLRDGNSLTADVYISALPHYLLGNLIGAAVKDPFFSRLNELRSSPIFSISLWYDREITESEFSAMIDTETQWLFNKSRIFFNVRSKGYVTLVISGAYKFLNMTNEEILKICIKEVSDCFPASRSAKLFSYLIQREKNATLSPIVGFNKQRLPQKTAVRNLFLCGDWTDTGFPATIESAVYSGVKAALDIEGNLI